MPNNQSPTPEEKGKTLERELGTNAVKLVYVLKEFEWGIDVLDIVKERDAIHSKHYARIEGEKEELVEVLGALYQEYCSVMHSEFDYSSADWSPERDNDEVAIRARDLLAKHTTSSPQGK